MTWLWALLVVYGVGFLLAVVVFAVLNTDGDMSWVQVAMLSIFWPFLLIAAITSRFM